MGQDATVNLGPVRKGKLRRQLGEDLDHLVNVDELHPALEFSWGMVPDKYGFGGTHQRLPASLSHGLTSIVRVFQAFIRD
jgi:hypothetical protein